MKLGFSTKSAGWISGYGELRKDDQFGVPRGRFPGETEHELEISGEVADGRIDLAECNPHETLS